MKVTISNCISNCAKLIPLILFTVSVFVQTATSGQQNQSLCKCSAIVLLYDVTGSCVDFLPLDSIFLRELLELTTLRTTIAFGLITDNSFKPFCRETFALDTLRLDTLLLSERAKAKMINDSIKADFEALKSQFVDRVFDMARVPRSYKSTDLDGAKLRLESFFNEPGFATCWRMTIAVTDAKSTVKGLPAGNPDCEFLVVGATSTQAQEVFGECLVFEGLPGVLDYLRIRLDDCQQILNTSTIQVGYH